MKDKSKSKIKSSLTLKGASLSYTTSLLYYHGNYPAIKVPVSPAEYSLGEWEGNDLQSSNAGLRVMKLHCIFEAPMMALIDRLAAFVSQPTWASAVGPPLNHM